eukprot:scaffold771_cov170-Amphora_coffeaeformis.AAC.15
MCFSGSQTDYKNHQRAFVGQLGLRSKDKAALEHEIWKADSGLDGHVDNMMMRLGLDNTFAVSHVGNNDVGYGIVLYHSTKTVMKVNLRQQGSAFP